MATPSNKPGVKGLLQSTVKDTGEVPDSYFNYQEEATEARMNKKEKTKASTMVSHFYDIATDFYEYGWSDCFHFFSINKGEAFRESQVRHELYLALKLSLTPQDEVLDVGCGVGGPARNIAKFSKAKISGITINEYQVKRAKLLTKEANLSHLCSFQQGDFTQLPQETGSLGKAYSIEATCHATEKKDVYGEVYRVLKPGGLFAMYEWVLRANKYNPQDPEQVKIAEGIQIGNGLPVLDTDEHALAVLRDVGFEILEQEDLALTSEVPWQSPLEPGFSNMRASPLGRVATQSMLFCLEKLRISPKGSTKVHSMLCKGADALVKGAKTEIFTPMLFVLCRKPLSKE